MNKKILYILIALIIAGLLVWPKLKGDDQAASPSRKQGPVAVSAIEVHPQATDRKVETTGNILANEAVILYPETQGRIVKIGFTEGIQVKKGQLLVKLDDAELQVQLKKAISTAQLKRITDDRNKSLLEKGAISREVYDQASNERNAADADVDIIREQIRKTEIRAPFDGKIGLRMVSEGSLVNPSTVIAGLHDLNKVKVEFSVSERYAGQVRTGSKITFTVDGNENIYEAEVYAVEPKIDEVTRNVIVRAICLNKDQKLLPGSFAKVSLAMNISKQTVMLPTQSIVPILKGQKVYLVQGDSVIERKVKTGIRDEGSIEVVDGLVEGDRVVVEGTLYLKQGTKVKATLIK